MTSKSSILIKTIVAVCLSCFVYNNSFAQSHKNTCEGRQDSILHKFVYTKVDEAAEPIGGLDTLGKLITKKFKYPPGDACYWGRVIVTFVIESNGSIDGKRIIRDPSGDKQLFGKQILNIINMVKWKPAKCNGQPIPCFYTLPINIDPSLSE